MKYKKELEQLSQLPYFDQVTIGNLLDISGPTLQMYVSRSIAKGQLIRLKRGIYITNDYYKFEREKQRYLEFLSNVLYSPSYLSLDYVLQKYAILSESVFVLTAITVKKTNKIVNDVGSFLYTNLKKDQFEGIDILNYGKYQIKQATKAKALYDYLYFAVKPWKKVTKGLVNELRLNLEEVGECDWQEFNTYIDKWSSVKMKKVQKIICNQ